MYWLWRTTSCRGELPRVIDSGTNGSGEPVVWLKYGLQPGGLASPSQLSMHGMVICVDNMACARLYRLPVRRIHGVRPWSMSHSHDWRGAMRSESYEMLELKPCHRTAAGARAMRRDGPGSRCAVERVGTTRQSERPSLVE